MDQQTLAGRRQQTLYDTKWKLFLRRSWPWQHTPFAEFVLAAGSMAIGNVHEHSDFDVIVAAKRGRIFTARFFSILVFGALGWRRPKLSHRGAASDKICLNHFVTEAAYRLKEPHDDYWRTLYRSLVPIAGEAKQINAFLKANADWMGARRTYRDDLRHARRVPSKFKTWLEKKLSGPFGNRLEERLKRIQIRRIERSLAHDPPGYKPRIRASDDELEFHPDTVRIEAYLRKRARSN